MLLVIGIAACATPPAPIATTIVPPTASDDATILAIRPVPVDNPRTARILLASLGDTAVAVDPPAVEYIVRDHGGTTISVVQAAMNGLRPGDRVSIQRGARTRIGDRLGLPGVD